LSTLTPQTLFLDAGGVLVYPDWGRVSRMLDRHGIGVSAAGLAAADPRAKRRLDCEADFHGTADRDRAVMYFRLVLEEAGVAASPSIDAAILDVCADHGRQNLWEHVPHDVVPALERLRRLGLRLVVVSNSNGTLRAMLQTLGLARHLDGVIDSHEEGVEKPDPALFRIALERSGARADRTIHVGDLYYVDVLGARAAGVRAVLLDPLDLYKDHACARVRSLPMLAERISAGWSE
jgi:putative hydrolase of the HAD superfamily